MDLSTPLNSDSAQAKMFCPWTVQGCKSFMVQAPTDHRDSPQQQLLNLGLMLMGLGYIAILLPLRNTAQA